MALLFTKESEKFVFFHIYKTGGNSVRHAISNSNLLKEVREIGGVHCVFSDVVDLLPPAKSFSIVRHPYDWVYSHFQYVRDISSHGLHEELMRNPRITTFLKILKRKRDEWRFQGNNFCSQYRICKGVDAVFKIEELSKSDFSELSDFIGVRLEVPHINKARSAKVPLTEEEKIGIQNLYPDDFQKLGYNP